MVSIYLSCNQQTKYDKDSFCSGKSSCKIQVQYHNMWLFFSFRNGLELHMVDCKDEKK